MLAKIDQVTFTWQLVDRAKFLANIVLGGIEYEDIAKYVVDEIGERFIIYLIQAVEMYENSKKGGSSNLKEMKSWEHLKVKNVRKKIYNSLQEGDF